MTLQRVVFFLVSLFLFESHLFIAGSSEAKEGTGLLTGQIRYLSDIPKRQIVPVKVNPDVCGSTVEVEELSVNPQNLGVKNVFISVKSKKSSDLEIDLSNNSLLINSQKCRFDPPAAVVMTNQTITLKNSDPVLHSIQFLSDDRFIFDAVLPVGSQPIRKRIEKEGIVTARCSIHPFMKASVYVTDSQQYTLTDQNGSFQFPSLQAGNYILKILHPYLKPVEKEIVVGPDQKINLPIVMEKRN